MIKPILIALTIFTSLPSLAAAKAASAAAPTSSGALNNSIGIDISATRGGIALGADFEHKLQSAIGVGGYFHFYSKSTANDHAADGMIFFGGQAVFHYDSGPWDLFIAPGVGFASIDQLKGNGTTDSKAVMTFGPRLAAGMLYQFNPNIAAGFEQSFYYSWFNSSTNGLLVNDLAAKLRITF